MIAVEQIEGLLKSFCSLFYLGSPNHKLMVEKCIEIAARNSMGVYGYNISQGIWRPGGAKPKKCDTDPIAMQERGQVFILDRSNWLSEE